MDTGFLNSVYRQTLPNNNGMMVPGMQSSKSKAPDIYIVDNLFLNLGKTGEFHLSFPDSQMERDKIFSGIIRETAQDHVLIHNEELHEWYLLPLLYLNYVVFKAEPVIPNNGV